MFAICPVTTPAQIKRQGYTKMRKFVQRSWFVTFITAVCVLFLITPRLVTLRGLHSNLPESAPTPVRSPVIWNPPFPTPEGWEGGGGGGGEAQLRKRETRFG